MSIAIIGGGLSGTLTAIHLLRNAGNGTHIYLVEQDRYRMHRGIAYSSQLPFQPLNVPVSAMSLFPDQPLDFFSWLTQYGEHYANHLSLPVKESDFVPRFVFGDYLKARLHEAETAAGEKVQLIRVYEEAVSITKHGHTFSITCSNQTQLRAQKVVLALGNFPPAQLPIPNQAFYKSPRYAFSPWSAKSLTGLPVQDTVLLIGSSLTMVDLVGSLHAQGHRGKIYVVSRHGLLPQPFDTNTQAYSRLSIPTNEPLTALGLLKRIRKEIRLAEAQGYTWRSVLDALRDSIPAIWQALPLPEQKAFLRHLRPYWETHRHRMPASSAQLLNRLQAAGQLQIIAASVQDMAETEDGAIVTVKRRGQATTEALQVDRVINCTGPQGDFTKLDTPLVRQLLLDGLAVPDVWKMGLATTGKGMLLNANNKSVKGLYTLGPARKGMLYESTALREIRQQAKALAQTLLYDKNASSKLAGPA